MGMLAIPGHDRTGYNGQTGASATWNDSKQMWVDTDGVDIRDDAIVATAPAPKAAAPPTPAPKAAPMQALSAAAEAPDGGAGFQELTSPLALNQNLGQRLRPSSLAALAQMAGRNY